MLLELGRAPSQADLNMKDGRTEVRVFNDEELQTAIELIDLAAA